MLKEVGFNEYVNKALEQLPKGAFMSVEAKGKKNTMTIGWGNVGIVWGKPMFIALVRYSRHTYELVEESNQFTISFPLNGQLKKELGFCGCQSGREYDKFKECDLTALAGKNVSSPMIEECDLHYECKVVYKQGMNPEVLNDELNSTYYSNGNYHMIYYGEIVGTYIKE